MSKIKIELDYIVMAQWAKFSLYNLDKHNNIEAKKGINRMMLLLDEAADRSMLKESEVKK